MDRLRPHEKDFFDRWLASLADGDARLLPLLEASLGRIAVATLRKMLARRGPGAIVKMGDLAGAKPGSPEDEVIAGWLRAAIDHGDEWLDDVDEAGVPRRLAECRTYLELLEAANQDYAARGWSLPGRRLTLLDVGTATPHAGPRAMTTIAKTKIISDEHILGGTPVVDGTRVPADNVLAEVRAGKSRMEVFRHYPSLPVDGIEACIEWEKASRPLLLEVFEDGRVEISDYPPVPGSRREP